MKIKRYSNKEVLFIKNNINGMSNYEISIILGRSKYSVQRKLINLRLKRSEKAVEKLKIENSIRNGLKRRKKIKYKKVFCSYSNLGDCWECISYYYKKDWSYPRIMRNYRLYQMSHYIYKKYFGSIPKGMCVLHKCDNKKCINPEHLFLGTQKDNMMDMIQKGRGKNQSGSYVKVI